MESLALVYWYSWACFTVTIYHISDYRRSDEMGMYLPIMATVEHIHDTWDTECSEVPVEASVVEKKVDLVRTHDIDPF